MAGRGFDLRIEYSFDGPRLLGTGSQFLSGPCSAGGRFLVFYGDSYLPIDHFESEAAPLPASGKEGLMTVFEMKVAGMRAMSGSKRVKSRYDKKQRTPEMHHIDYGLGILRADSFLVAGEII